MKRLIICHGYFGDHYFATALAEFIKKEHPNDTVDYVIGWEKVRGFFERNPFIDDVFIEPTIGPMPLGLDQIHHGQYDKITRLSPLSFIIPPVTEYKQQAGLVDTSPEFTLYTDEITDAMVLKGFEELKRPIVAYMANWEERSFGFTREQYEKAIDVPNLGYGGKHRNIELILSIIQKQGVTLLEVGAPQGTTQFDNRTDVNTLDADASILKYCDYFIGAEGGMANLAAGVGCKTILTSDFVHQLYGPKGSQKQIHTPKLGPRYYFNLGHYDLDPYLTDTEVAHHILQIIGEV